MVECGGNKKIYTVCEKIFRDLYKKNSLFKNGIDENNFAYIHSQDGVFRLGSSVLEVDIPSYFNKVDIEGFSKHSILGISFTNIYKYYSDGAYLYGRGVAILGDSIKGLDIASLDTGNKGYEYPLKDEVLIRKGDTKTWSKSGKITKKFSRILKACSFYDEYNMAKVYMDGGKLVLAFYSPLQPPRKVIYGEDRAKDKLLETLVATTEKMKIPVEAIYWFLEGNYNSIRCKKGANDEYILVVS